MNHAAPMFAAPQSAQLLMDLDTQQDEILRQLDELNERIEKTIVLGQMSVRTPDGPIAIESV